MQQPSGCNAYWAPRLAPSPIRLAKHEPSAACDLSAGHACATNPIAIVVPCHRIVGSDGSLHGYGGGLMKRYLLQLEGVLLNV